jgi:multidrug resistance protein, MATE family
MPPALALQPSLPAPIAGVSLVCRIEAAAALRLSAPIALVALVNMAMSVTDMVMAAAFGAAALAAVAVGSDAYSIVFYFAGGVVAGLGPTYAAALAAGDEAGARRQLRIGWLIVAVVAAAGVPAVWFAPNLLLALGLEAGLVEDGTGYTRAMAVALVPMLVVALFRTRLSAEERPGILLRVTLAAVPLNAALNLLLMFGVAGWPGYGITGAGLSSLLVACFVASVLVWAGRRPRAAGPAPRVALRQVLDVLRTGIQIGVATVAEVGVFLGATLFAATLGSAEAAAHAVAMRAAGLAYALPAGLLQAATVRTARAGASGCAATCRTAIATSLLVASGAGVLLFLLAAAAAGALLGAGPAGDPGAASLAAGLLLIVGLIQLYDAPSAAAAGCLRGLKDTRMPMILTLLGYWGIGAPLGVWLSGSLGATGIWIGLAAGTAVTAALMIGRLRRHLGSAQHPSDASERRHLSAVAQKARSCPERP